jgi:hypothetical protein
VSHGHKQGLLHHVRRHVGVVSQLSGSESEKSFEFARGRLANRRAIARPISLVVGQSVKRPRFLVFRHDVCAIVLWPHDATRRPDVHAGLRDDYAAG